MSSVQHGLMARTTATARCCAAWTCSCEASGPTLALASISQISQSSPRC